MLKLFLSLCPLCLTANIAAAPLSQWSATTMNEMLGEAQHIVDPGERVAFISTHFLNTRYQANTLVGSATVAEQFTIRWDAVDCMTFIEYVEAMRLSSTLDEIPEQLVTVRYHAGEVDYYQRKHFFTDWLQNNTVLIEDVTALVGQEASLQALKKLNDGATKTLLPDIPISERVVNYIPANKINTEILHRLKNGDYIGIYSDRPGLDVNHVGILIHKPTGVYFRHADSDAPNRKVVDVNFEHFFKRQRGFMVFRPH